MKIENNTNWDTDQFRAFVEAVAKNEKLTPEEIGQLKVIIGYRRRSSVRRDEYVLCRGWKNWQIEILCVKGVELYKPYLARAIAFALNYIQGVRPRTIRLNPRFYGNVVKEWQWANNLPLTMKQEQLQPQKQPVENKQYVVVKKKMQHCLRQIVLWEKKAKLAEIKLSQWHARLRQIALVMAKCVPASCASDSSGFLENSDNVVVAEERKVHNE